MRRRLSLTLVEILVAVLVAACGVAAIATLGRQSARQDVTGELVAVLETNLRARLDLVARQPFERLRQWALVPGWSVPEAGLHLPTAVREVTRAHRARVVLLEEGLARVDLEARWALSTDPAGTSRVVRVSRLVAQQDASFGATYGLLPR